VGHADAGAAGSSHDRGGALPGLERGGQGLPGQRPSRGRLPALRRQAAAQLPVRGIHRDGASGRAHRVPAPRTDGYLPGQLPAAAVPGQSVVRLLLRPARYRALRAAIRTAGRALATGVPGTDPGTPLRGPGGGPGGSDATTAGVLRPGLGPGLPGVRTQPGGGLDCQRGPGPRTAAPRLDRALATLRPAAGGTRGPAGVRLSRGRRRWRHDDAVDGAGRHAQLATGAQWFDHRVHVLRAADDGVHGTGLDALGAADAVVLDDQRDPCRLVPAAAAIVGNGGLAEDAGEGARTRV